MNLEIENDLWADAKCSALKVDFLSTKEELSLYANALYSAVMWGMGIDGKNMVILERDKSVKQEREPSARPPNSPYTIMMQIYPNSKFFER